MNLPPRVSKYFCNQFEYKQAGLVDVAAEKLFTKDAHIEIFPS